MKIYQFACLLSLIIASSPLFSAPHHQPKRERNPPRGQQLKAKKVSKISYYSRRVYPYCSLCDEQFCVCPYFDACKTMFSFNKDQRAPSKKLGLHIRTLHNLECPHCDYKANMHKHLKRHLLNSNKHLDVTKKLTAQALAWHTATHHTEDPTAPEIPTQKTAAPAIHASSGTLKLLVLGQPQLRL